MIYVVAPEPAAWLQPLVEQATRDGDVRVLAPWAMPDLGWRVPFVERRRLHLEGAQVEGITGWPALEAGMRAWTRGRTERRMEARFRLRRYADGLASLLLPRNVDLVIAPSCAVLHTFKVAMRRGVPTVLVEDVPDMRQMHADLDLAASQHPKCAFLRRYRAAEPQVARQEAERRLAGSFYVRGDFTRRLLVRQGVPIERISNLPGTQVMAAAVASHGPLRRILLAGLATGRSGIMEALAVVESDPERVLLVSPGEGLEPADLLMHPQVRRASPAAKDRLQGVDLVLAPAWCESYPPEVPLAWRLGVPVVASDRASGDVAPEDVEGLKRAVNRAIGTSEWNTPLVPARS